MKSRLTAALIVVIGLLAARPRPAAALQHLWEIKEVYSNADGSVQYIELFTPSGSQNSVNGFQVTATWAGGAQSNTFTFGTNIVGSTTNKHLLIATDGFSALCGGVTPNFNLPDDNTGNFFFDPAAVGDITISFVRVDSITFSNASLPKNGHDSLTDQNLGGAANLVAGASSPTNFTGNAGALNLTGCNADGNCSDCGDGVFCNGDETVCQAATGTCTGTDPCPGQECLESGDACVECLDAGDCNDTNVCTNDSCNGSNVCVHAPNTNDCDDGLFCNGADTCGGSTCNHAGDPCAPAGCLEGSDSCGDCDDPTDCDDGLFCTGDESCSGGACSSAGDPCTPDACDEDGDSCAADPPDAGVPDSGTPDAAFEDALPSPDAGEEGGGGGGCCRTGADGAPGALLVAALVGLALRPRRNRRYR